MSHCCQRHTCFEDCSSGSPRKPFVIANLQMMLFWFLQLLKLYLTQWSSVGSMLTGCETLSHERSHDEVKQAGSITCHFWYILIFRYLFRKATLFFFESVILFLLPIGSNEQTFHLLLNRVSYLHTYIMSSCDSCLKFTV